MAVIRRIATREGAGRRQQRQRSLSAVWRMRTSGFMT